MKKNRFEIDTEGMALLHEGRPMWSLVKELISNTWDENITTSKVWVNNIPTKGIVEIIVEDDGAGFKDITDAYTLMSPTSKQGNADVRGRFNLGEKEFFSVARQGSIETVGHTIKFPLTGGKTKRKNDRVNGTRVWGELKGRVDQIQSTVDMLKRFIAPEGVDYQVNSNYAELKESPERVKSYSFNATLPTVINNGPMTPMRNTKRKTDVDVYPPTSEKGAIYEMGIFIQDIDAPFDINVLQKVPLPPNRDTVRDKYLQDIYAELLNVAVDDLTEDTQDEVWVTLAVESRERITQETGTTLKKLRYGNGVLWSSDMQANDEAIAKGMEVHHPRTLGKQMSELMKDAGMLSSAEQFRRTPESKKVITPTPDMERVGKFAKFLAGKLLGIDIDVEYIRNPNMYFTAQYGAKQLTFEVGKLGEQFFKNCPNESQVALILHELGHESKAALPHAGEAYRDMLTKLGAKGILQNPMEDWSEVA